MKRLRIELLPAKDGDSVIGSFTVEGKKGGAWSRIEHFDVVSGTPGAQRDMLLDDDERIVIEGSQTHVAVYDKEQNAAVPEPAHPEERRKKRENDARIRAESIQAEEQRQRGLEERPDVPRTTLGRPQPFIPPQPPLPVGSQTPHPAAALRPVTSSPPLKANEARIVEDNSPPVEPKPKVEATKTPDRGPNPGVVSEGEGFSTQASSTPSSKDVKK